MAAKFGIGGEFLAKLARTGKLSDTDLQRIMGLEGGIEEAADLLHNLAQEARDVTAHSKQAYNRRLDNVGLGEGVARKLADAKLFTVAALAAEGGPGEIRARAGLTPEEMVEIVEVLRRYGIELFPLPPETETTSPNQDTSS